MLDEPEPTPEPAAIESEISAVGGTALIVANCRARASRVPDPWFVDPLALYLASRHESWDQWTFSRGLLAWISVRTRFLDELISTAVGSGIGQVVLLGAGLDARGFRLDLPASTRLFEIDRADVLTIKERAIRDAGLTPVCDRRVVSADLIEDDWIGGLTAAGWDVVAGTVWIAEGLLIYFEQEQRETLLQDVQMLSTPNDVLGATMAAREVAPDQPLWKPTPRTSPATWLRTCGWQANVRTMAEVSGSYGQPINTPGRGRAELIRATPTDPGELR